MTMDNPKKTITLRLDPDLHHKFKIMAAISHKTLTEIAIAGIQGQIKQYYLEQHKKHQEESTND